MRITLRPEMVVPLLGLLAGGASPNGGFSTAAPWPDFTLSGRPAPPRTAAPSGYTEAPRPNEDVSAPQARASTDASLAPGFFTRHKQYRGEGFSPNSSAQIDEDRKVSPGAGVKLNLPLQ